MKPSSTKQSNAVRISLLSLLGMVAFLILVFSNSGRLPNQLHSFIENRVIPGFEGQRQQKYQFAVLLLIPESDLNNINLVSLQPQDNNQQPLVDNTNCYCPSRAHYRNYVAARPYLTPRGIVHSEQTLLQELPHLWDAFVASYGFVPSYIILYSWMMPCPVCTEQICQALRGTRYENTSVIIAYTIDWKKIPAVENKKSREKLEAAGIKVEQVKYRSYLPPARQHEDTDDELIQNMAELHLDDTPYDLTDSEEYDEDSEEDSDEDNSEEYEDEVEEDLMWQFQGNVVGDIHTDVGPTSQLLQEDYTSEQPSNGLVLNEHPPEGAFPEVPVRRKPPQAKIPSTQADTKSLNMMHTQYILQLLRTDADNTLQCTDSEDSDSETGAHIPREDPPDRYKLM